MLLESVRSVSKRYGSRNIIYEATFLCINCGYETTTQVSYDVGRVLKIQNLVSLLPDDLKSDPNLYRENLCVEVGKCRICESYGLLKVYDENGDLILVTPNVDDVRVLLENKIPGLVMG